MTSLHPDAGIEIAAGFGDPVDDAQRVFRAFLAAMAEPGRILALPSLGQAGLPAAPGPAALAFGLALFDFETPVWFDAAALPALPTLRFHANCPRAAEPSQAAFALIGDAAAVPPFEAFSLGTDAYPDRSTTLVIEVPTLERGAPVRLTGPGIETWRSLAVGGLPAGFWTARAALQELFPRGIDLVFTSGDRLAAVPRTTQATEEVPDVRRS